MLKIEALPAREGDALWIEWGEPRRRMIVDMGTHGVGEQIHQRIRKLPEAERTFELLIVTHVDRDHIGGVLSCLAEGEPIPGLAFRDVWFNGWDHLHGRSVPEHPLEPMGAAQGETLSAWLRSQRWNEAFGRGPVIRPADTLADPIVLPGGLELTILGPTQSRLTDFIEQWDEEVADAVERGTIDEPVRGLESLGQAGRPPRFDSAEDLEALALEPTGLDTSKANGSSIAVLAKHGNARALLTGDAFAAELVEALKLIKPVGPVNFDLVKLPHHGSEKNVTIDLVEKLNCPRWLISTDGTRYKHPDPVAVARLIRFSRSEHPEIIFNTRSEFSEWWDRTDWRDEFGYRTRYGAEDSGVAISLG